MRSLRTSWLQAIAFLACSGCVCSGDDAGEAAVGGSEERPRPSVNREAEIEEEQAWQRLADRAGSASCTASDVAVPPKTLGFPPFYQKYVDACGVPIVASDRVSDDALLHAARLLSGITAQRPSVRRKLVEHRLRIAVLAVTEPTDILPEYRHMRERGIGPKNRGYRATTRMPLISVGEENLLCFEADIYRHQSMLVHNLALSMLALELTSDIEGFEKALSTAYTNAMKNETWPPSSHARKDVRHYWAEGAQSWFDANYPAQESISTRDGLRDQDPELGILLESVFGEASIEWCPVEPKHLPHTRLPTTGMKPSPPGPKSDECGLRTVSSPPAALGFDAFYEKYTDACGIAVVSSARVRSEALLEVRRIIIEMTSYRPELRAALSERQGRVAVIATSERRRDVPEHSSLRDDLRGAGGVLENPVTSTAEENVLCFPSDRNHGYNLTVHEFAHSIMNVALATTDPKFQGKVRESYRSAMRAGLWTDTYGATNPREYWAEGALAWFDAGPRKPITTRQELLEYDPALANLLSEVFGPAPPPISCPQR